MRYLIWLAVLAIVGSAAWRYRASFLDLGPPAPPPKRIIFDNGTARTLPLPPPPLASGARPNKPIGELRKCVRRAEVSYTNFACPNGFTEQAVKSDRLTVLDSGDAKPVTPEKPRPDARKTLRDALDISDDKDIRTRIMERAAEGNAK
jgi:hypothetical protein